MSRIKNLNALEIAKIACNVESDGIAFYKAAASKASDKQAQAVFETLMRQEQAHLSTFRNLYKTMDAQMGGSESTTVFLFDDEITQYLNAVSEGMIFPQGHESKQWFDHAAGVAEIVSYALNVEKNSVLFYTEIAEHNSFAHSRTLLQEIIKEEKWHVVILSRLLERPD